jgi:hypothetical protein
MRNSLTKVGLLLVATAGLLSLSGCSDALFSETAKWKGGTFYSNKKHIIQPPVGPMTLALDTDGRGYAVGIPRGHQKMANNLCIEVTSDDRYDGMITWRKASDYDFEISFPGSKYRVSDGPGKFVADWTEVRIYTCTPGGEFWTMQLHCAQPGLVVRDPPRCRD